VPSSFGDIVKGNKIMPAGARGRISEKVRGLLIETGIGVWWARIFAGDESVFEYERVPEWGRRQTAKSSLG